MSLYWTASFKISIIHYSMHYVREKSIRFDRLMNNVFKGNIRKLDLIKQTPYRTWWHSMFMHILQLGEHSRSIVPRTMLNSMMTSSNGNIFRVTGHLCGEFTGPRWIPCTKASDAELWCFLWSASSKQSWGWWFETLPRPLWRHSYAKWMTNWMLCVMH